MPNDQNAQNRRPHHHRGRRGGERRNLERRTPAAGPEPSHRDHVDVEQVMRDIRARIASRHGIDFTPQQIQELAARRLDAILEPRHVKPALLEQMRRAAGEPIEVPAPAPAVIAPFDESELYRSHRPFLQWLRKVLNPILKLFINPAPVAQALSAQAAQSSAAAVREAELYAKQAEWNALHYEIIRRLVTELSRTTIEMQSLTQRMEAVDAKLDFNERRVRAMELTAHQSRPTSRPPVEAVSAPAEGSTAVTAPSTTSGTEATSEGARRRRRRRRGRRNGFEGQDGGTNAQPSANRALPVTDIDADVDADEGDEDVAGAGPAQNFAQEGGESTALEPAHNFSLLQPDERYPSGELAPAPVTADGAHQGNAPPASSTPADDTARTNHNEAGPEPPEQ